MGVDRKDGGNGLGSKKNQQGIEKESFGENQAAFVNHADEPETADNDSSSVGDKHFGKFKEFGGVGCPNEGSENEEELEGEEDELFDGGGHGKHYIGRDPPSANARWAGRNMRCEIRRKKKEVRRKN